MSGMKNIKNQFVWFPTAEECAREAASLPPVWRFIYSQRRKASQSADDSSKVRVGRLGGAGETAMKEYKAERLTGLQQMSQQMLENTLNIAAIAEWELVCVSDGWAFYVRERRPLKLEPEKQS